MTRTTKHSTSRCSLDLKQFAGCRWASRPIGTCLPPSTRRESARPSLPHTPYLFVHDLSGSTKLCCSSRHYWDVPSIYDPRFLYSVLKTIGLLPPLFPLPIYKRFGHRAGVPGRSFAARPLCGSPVRCERIRGLEAAI